MITNNKYILASSSLSRYKILKNCGFKFKKYSPKCDEEKVKSRIKNKNIKASTLAKKLAFEKARSISIEKKHLDKFVIGCDTLIYLDNKILDKAKNLKEAKSKLNFLSGREHKIISGLSVCKGGKLLWQCSETTTVVIRKLNNKNISEYLKKTGKQIFNSVGCYQIESLGPNIIEEIKGDFFNVMGLPLFRLLKYVSKN